MEITRELIEQRLEQLAGQKMQAIAQVNAIAGAIEELDQWKMRFDKESDAEPKIKISK
jgi:hypothetical protein